MTELEKDPNVFYPANEIQDKLICSYCNNTFTDPRVLPCQHTICAKCFENNHKFDTLFDCRACHKSYVIPFDQDLPIDELMSDLLKIEPTPISKSSEFDMQLKLAHKNIRELDDQIKLTASFLNNDQFISDHFEKVKIDIDLALKKRIQELDNHGIDFISQLKRYQSFCLDKQNINFYTEFKKHIDDYNQRFIQWSSLLDKPDVEENEAMEIKREAEELNQEFITKITKIKNLEQLNDKIDFIESQVELSPNIIGFWTQKYDFTVNTPTSTMDINNPVAEDLRAQVIQR